jgi:hypothetical protein
MQSSCAAFDFAGPDRRWDRPGRDQSQRANESLLSLRALAKQSSSASSVWIASSLSLLAMTKKNKKEGRDGFLLPPGFVALNPGYELRTSLSLLAMTKEKQKGSGTPKDAVP